MRKIINKLVFVCAALVLGMSSAYAVTTLNVTVKNEQGNALSGVDLVVVNYGMNGPSTNTLFGQSDGSGQYAFTLIDGMNYNLYANKHGYSPTIRDQFNNPDPSVQRYFWPNGTTLSSTITLTNDQTEVGKIQLPFINATPSKVLFGNVNINGLQESGYFGMVQSNGSGGGTLTVDNVPYAEANTYSIGIYDPEKNRGIGQNVLAALDANTPLITMGQSDFDQSVPPKRVENTATQNSGGSSMVSVEGLVRHVDYSTVTIPHMGLSLRYCNPGSGQSNLWTNADQNGRFQLYGLLPGVTYYVEAMGGCAWDQNGPAGCYGPSRNPGLTQDLCMTTPPPPAPGLNDFVYVSTSETQYLQVKLSPMPRSEGKINVYVKSSSGYRIPNAMVNIHPDGSPWSTNGCSGQQSWNTTLSNPGFANMNVQVSATGYALLDGLPSGNYMLNVWTPFSNSGSQAPINAGDDGDFDWNWQTAHCDNSNSDDFRISIDTTNPNYLEVYDNVGNPIAMSSITYIVNTDAAMSGEVKGTVKFPGIADLRESPIMITLYPQCSPGSPCMGGNFTAIDSSGSDHYEYSINVASGAAYWMNVKGINWGRVQRGGGNNSINLESTGTVTIDMEFIPGGTISGTLYKPDGTAFTPANNQYIWVDAGTENGWTGTQVQKDGTFIITDALPGINRMSINASGNSNESFNYSLGSPQPTVTVVAGSTITMNLNLVNAINVGINLNLNRVPDRTIIASQYDSVLGFRVVPMPAGSVLNSEAITKMLTKGGDDDMRFVYATSTTQSQEGRCGQNWPGGFCGSPVPSPSVYDFYLMRSGDFGDMSSTAPATNLPYPHFVLLSSSKNVIIDSGHANSAVRLPYSNTVTSGVVVDLTPATDMSNRGNATLSGVVTANNFFRQSDYEATAGDFDKFVEFLPVVTLYDTNGKFSAAGIVVPPMEFIRAHDKEFDLAFAQGYQAFDALLSSAAYFGYEMRGLEPSTCYTAVLTTPNYPHYQSRVCTGVNRSTVNLNIDLDSAVGSGATVLGVVKSSAVTPVNIANALVEISGEGMDKRSVVTSSAGLFRFDGLSAGTVKITVSADGYAQNSIEEDLYGNNTYQKAIFLVSAPGSISGTVYSQKMPYAKVQPGALIYAYDDTYNYQNPTAPLPLLKTLTGSDGTYSLTGLVPGHTYKVFLKVPGKYTLRQSTEAVSGDISGMDFTMLSKPLDIEIFGRLGTNNSYEFTVLNPQDFKSGNASWSVSPYNAGSATTLQLDKLSSGELRGVIPSITAGVTYVLRAVAVSLTNKTITKEILFGTDYRGNSEQAIDDVILGDDSDDGKGRKSNEAPMDNSGDDPSAVIVPAGAMLPISTAAIPACTFKSEDKDSSGAATKIADLGAAAFASDLYTVELTSVSLNPDKGFDLSLAYDKTTSSLDDLSVARYDDVTGKWESYTGVATVNPVKGTVKVKLKSLASVLSKGSGQKPSFSTFNGKEYVTRPSAGSGSTSGTFAVVRPSIAGNAYAGTKLKVFNFPNPFNLKSKTNTPAQGVAAQTTNGTTIHVEVPSANGGPGHIRIYTLAGELVRDLAVDFTAGTHNYVNWDGKNKGGQEVANGVYYGVVELSGKKPSLKDATFKMAVIK